MEESIQKVIMGLDISTSTIGMNICVLFDNGNIVPVEATAFSHKIKKVKDSTEALFIKSQNFKKEVTAFEKYNITDVVIEEPLVSSNNSLTASTLLRYNGMISQAIYDVLGVVPKFISSYDARKYSFPELLAVRVCNKKGEPYPQKKIIKDIKDGKLVLFGEHPFDADKKVILWDKIKDKFDVHWEKDKKGNLKKQNYDVSDSFVCTLGFLNKERYGQQQAKTQLISVSDEEVIYEVKVFGNIFQKKVFFNK